MKIGIGIDTGGTCTDAVAYDFDTETLLAKGKALTTREDLSIGIGNALDLLPPELVSKASLIALSTTLATNACVESKGCRAKLLIFGLTDELIVRYGAEKKYGFLRESVRCVDTHGSADGLKTDEPDWEDVMTELGPWLRDADALAVSELYSTNNGAPCEKRLSELSQEQLGLKCVCASELSAELDVLARGATALLNARLFPIGREFIEAALSDFRSRGCSAPVMVVRSDGSLMSAELTRARPVETILSGPAASVLAGRGFADEDDCLIIDMGGTTTDVSVSVAGRPAMADGGISIGGWRTHVKGVYVDTFALGGDSTVRMRGDKPALFPRRAMSVCSAALRWPEVTPMLRDLLAKKHVNQFPLHEFFYLVRGDCDLSRYNTYEQDLIAALRDGPKTLGLLAATKRADPYHLDSERLEAEGVVMRCGLTPTDFMHISGDYCEYDAEASVLAARFLLLTLGREDTQEALDALVAEVYDMVQGYMYENLLRIILARQYPDKFADGLDAQTELLVRQSWEDRHSDKPSLLRYSLGTNAALVGVGAPTYVFLPEVAKALGAKCVLPEHAEVANAIGALKADIHAVTRVEVSQRLSSNGEMFYIVHAPTGSSGFDDLDEAKTVAMAAAEEAALREARARGALGQLTADTYITQHSTVSTWGSSVSLGCTAISEVTARFL